MSIGGILRYAFLAFCRHRTPFVPLVTEQRLALLQRGCPHVLAFDEKEIEGDVGRLASAKQQVIEDRPAGLVECDDLAVVSERPQLPSLRQHCRRVRAFL